MIANILWIQSGLNFFLNRNFICYGLSQIFEVSIISKEQLSFIILWLGPAFRFRDATMYLVFSAFTTSPISLLSTNKASAFFFIVCMLPPNLLTSSASTSSWCLPLNFKPSWFTWTLLMAYSKAKLKSNGERTSPYLKQFFIRNVSNKFLPTRTLLYVSFRHSFISLTNFMGITNSIRVLHNTSRLSES